MCCCKRDERSRAQRHLGRGTDLTVGIEVYWGDEYHSEHRRLAR